MGFFDAVASSLAVGSIGGLSSTETSKPSDYDDIEAYISRLKSTIHQSNTHQKEAFERISFNMDDLPSDDVFWRTVHEKFSQMK